MLADFDIELSDALTRFVYHILFGKVDPERLDATAFHTFDDDYVHFRNDVYDRDHAILKELQEPFKRKERHLGEN